MMLFPLLIFVWSLILWQDWQKRKGCSIFGYLISDALAKIHSRYGAIDSAYFQQEFACNLKKLHHAPEHQSRYAISYVQNQEIHVLRQGLLMRQTKMEGYIKVNGGSKYTHLTIYCHSLQLVHEEVLLMLEGSVILLKNTFVALEAFHGNGNICCKS